MYSTLGKLELEIRFFLYKSMSQPIKSKTKMKFFWIGGALLLNIKTPREPGAS